MHYLAPGRNRILSGTVIASLAFVSACSGGGGSAVAPHGPGGANPPPPNPAAQAMAVTFSAPASMANAAVTVTSGRATVATGMLNSHGSASLNFAQNVPRGATVQVAAGAVTATLTLASDTASTNAQVNVNQNGTLTVNATDSNGGESESETEDEHGNVTSVQNGGQQALPSNLPLSIVASCTTLTLTPTDADDAIINFIEKVHDGDGDHSGRVDVENLPFSSTQNNPLVEPIVSGMARVKIEIFNSSRQRLVSIQAPINAFTMGTAGQPTPAPCPSTSAQPTQSPEASETPESPEPSESPESPEPSESPESPEPSGSPGH